MLNPRCIRCKKVDYIITDYGQYSKDKVVLKCNACNFIWSDGYLSTMYIESAKNWVPEGKFIIKEYLRNVRNQSIV